MSTKEHKDVDIVKELLPEIDRRNYNFFANLPKFYKKSGQEDPNKGIDFVPLLRWASAVGKEEVNWAEARRQGRKKGDGKGKWPSTVSDEPFITAYYIELINDLVNVHFWEMTDHPELLYKLFSLAGCGVTKTHLWIKAPAKKNRNMVFDMLKEFYPTASRQELEFFFSQNNKKELLEVAQLLGYQNEQIKDLEKQLKELGK